MNKHVNLAAGIILGAGLMYILDPDRGKRRRALVRDQVAHGANEFEELGERIAGKSQDLRNRVYGVAVETRARLRREEVDDPVLEARVRSEIGRALTNPGSIQVTAIGGRVTLSGLVLEDEVEELLSTVSSVRGVDEVENRLDPRSGPGDVPGLQGGGA